MEVHVINVSEFHDLDYYLDNSLIIPCELCMEVRENLAKGQQVVNIKILNYLRKNLYDTGDDEIWT